MARKAEEERLKAIEDKRRRSHLDWFDMTIQEMSALINETELDMHMGELSR